MSWIKVECSVARNRKFVKAGPGPSWLWLCGLTYCQEGLTNGFIPDEAIEFLGVRNARHLIKHLVTAGLWDAADGGWLVHDYLEHNKSGSEVKDLKSRRATGGSLGGRPKKNLSENLQGNSDETFLQTHDCEAVAVDASVAEADLNEHITNRVHFQADVALAELQTWYPQNRVTYGYKTQTEFIAQLSTGCADDVYATMRANLENHLRSHEWRVKGMAPALDKWLREGLWKRQMDEAPPPAEQVTAKTNRTLSAAAGILKEPA